MPVVLVLLVFIGALAVLYRRELTEQFDKLLGTSEATKSQETKTSDDLIVRHEPAPIAKKESPREPKVERKVQVPPEPEVKNEEPGTEIEHEPLMLTRKKRPSGWAWAPLEPSVDEGFGVVARASIKVLVPSRYGKPELMKVAQDVVKEELKRHGLHAMRIYFYGDKLHLRPEDAMAVAEWGPGGDYNKAEDALQFGRDRNEISLLKK